MPIKRALLSELKTLQAKFPIIAITGPRQSGKTTLMKQAFPKYRYVSLENPDNRLFASLDPKVFIGVQRSGDFWWSAESARIVLVLARNSGYQSKNGSVYFIRLTEFSFSEKYYSKSFRRVALCSLFPFDLREMKKPKSKRKSGRANHHRILSCHLRSGHWSP